MNTIKIGDKTIGFGLPVYIIAEMSANHGGSFERAKEIIKAAKDSGADCIKLQTYTADTLTIDCKNQYFNIEDGTWEGKNLYELYKTAYTPWEWQKELKEYAEELGLDFLSTPFDNTAVDFLESIGVKFYKIASFEIVDIPLIKYIASKQKPIIMSTGMASLGEIEEAINAIRAMGNDQICVLKCSSSYPAVTDDMNLSTIKTLGECFDVTVGLSDHTMGAISSIVAVCLGATVIEKHFCISRDIETADSKFSMEPNEFSDMILSIREAEKAVGKTNFGATESEKSNVKFRKSIFVVEDIHEGELFTDKNIRVIRPGYGISPKYYDDIIGKRAQVGIKRGTPLSFSMYK